MKLSLTILWSLLLSATASAGQLFLDGKTAKPASVDEAVRALRPGTIVILSEQHDLKIHHENQSWFLNKLANNGTRFSVGMEFFPRYRQSAIDNYLAGDLTRDQFLKAVEWAGDNYDYYDELVMIPTFSDGTTIGLNTPRWLTSKIVESGFESLTTEDLKFLPANFTLGNEGYKERFREAMGGHHIPECAFERYFTAQSAWDDTMAETACDFVTKNPEQVLTIIVGDFHAIYGGGLPDRIKARGCKQVVVISQTLVDNLDNPESNPDLMPNPKWGPRADFIWAAETPEGYIPAAPKIFPKAICKDKN